MNLIAWIKAKLNPPARGWDVLRFCERYAHPRPGEYDWYAVRPSVIYPQTIARILQAIHDDTPPAELLEAGPLPDGVARSLLAQARSVPEKAWPWAETPRHVFDDPDLTDLLPARNAALECARLWFTQAIHSAAGGPVGVKILAEAPEDKAYRL